MLFFKLRAYTNRTETSRAENNKAKTIMDEPNRAETKRAKNLKQIGPLTFLIIMICQFPLAEIDPIFSI